MSKRKPNKDAAEPDLAGSAVQIFVRFRPPKDGKRESQSIHRINTDMVRVDGADHPQDAAPSAKSTPASVRRSSIETASPSQQSRHGGLFRFHHIFGPSTQAQEVYDVTTSPLVDTLFEGLNCTVMAYGQTGSGKTHTMLGAPESAGVIPRTLAAIFRRIEDRKATGWTAKVRISNIQVYLEKVLDLLRARNDLFDPDAEPSLHVRQRESVEGGPDEIYVDKVTWKNCKTADRAMHWLNFGNSHRVTAATDMNAVSSRSHSVFMLELEQINMDTQKHLISLLYLVDLAGSETVKRTGAQGIVLQQACHVNKSLTILSNVISALSNKRAHIPYRDSKLTRLLTHALGGNSRTSIILACSSAEDDLVETLSTLQFGKRALDMPNKPRVNKVLTIDDYKKLLEKAEEMLKSQKLVIQALEREVETLRAKKEPNPAQAAAVIEQVNDMKAISEWETKVEEESKPIANQRRILRHIRRSLGGMSPKAIDEINEPDSASSPGGVMIAADIQESVVEDMSGELVETVVEPAPPVTAESSGLDLPMIADSPFRPPPARLELPELEEDTKRDEEDDEDEDPAISLPPLVKSTRRRPLADQHPSPQNRYFTPRTLAALSNELVVTLRSEKEDLERQLAEVLSEHQREVRGDSVVAAEPRADDPPQVAATADTTVAAKATEQPTNAADKMQTLDIVFISVGGFVSVAAIVALVLILRSRGVSVPALGWVLMSTAAAGSLVLGWGLPAVA